MTESSLALDQESKRYPLSFTQEWFCTLDQGDAGGAFGRRFILVCPIRVTGHVDLAVLQGALDDVVSRHELLRTVVVRDATPPYQLVRPPCPVPLELRDLPPVTGKSRDMVAQELIVEAEAGTMGAQEVPMLRALLCRFDDRDSVLFLTMHHSVTDLWSIQVLIRDLGPSTPPDPAAPRRSCQRSSNTVSTRSGRRPVRPTRPTTAGQHTGWRSCAAGVNSPCRTTTGTRRAIPGSSVLLGVGIGLAFAALGNLIVQAVLADQTGAASGMNTVLRTLGGALGGQISVAFVVATTTHGLPTLTGFTKTFVMGALVLVGCAAAGLHIPVRASSPTAPHPATFGAR